ncbi:MAG: hypothetical protein HY902_12215 [Deltaproteobacteria bacterium]|nr:hypothetical protein [Deltaproteobacteria bacterium]
MALALRALAWPLALLAAVAVLTSSALAAHLPAGRETAVKALVLGPELAELGLEVQSVAIQRAEIAVVVAGAASGVLHLEELGASPQAFAKSPSFALRWTSAQPGTPPVVQTWAGRITARDTGGWWVSEASAPPLRQAPALAWSVAVGGGLWLLLLLGLLVGPAPAKALAWSVLAVSTTAATQWLLARGSLSYAAREAMAGRSGSPLAALAALWRWHFHVPEGLVDGASAALCGLLLGTALPRLMLRVPLLCELPAVGMAAVAALAGAVSLATVGLYHSLGVSLVALCLAVPPRGAGLPQWAAAAALIAAQVGWFALAAP